MECSICYESFDYDEDLVKTICNHVFCKECLIEWININDTCPVCRNSTPIPKNKIQEIINNDLPLLPCTHKINKSKKSFLNFCNKSVKFKFTIDCVEIYHGKSIIEEVETCNIKTVNFENNCININRRKSSSGNISVLSFQCTENDSKKLINMFNSMFYRYRFKYLDVDVKSYLGIINQMQIRYNNHNHVNNNYEDYNSYLIDSDNEYDYDSN